MIFKVTETTQRGKEKRIGLCEVSIDGQGMMLIMTPDGQHVTRQFERCRVHGMAAKGMLVSGFENRAANKYEWREFYLAAVKGGES